MPRELTLAALAWPWLAEATEPASWEAVKPVPSGIITKVPAASTPGLRTACPA